jgi:hypothetical protein
MAPAPRPVRLSAVRHHLLSRKTMTSDSGWRSDQITPRFGPYPETRPCPAGWQWRSLALSTPTSRKYRLFFEVDPSRGKWKAVLVEVTDAGRCRALIRFEDQPGGRGGGLHVHANCDRNPDLTGAESLDMAYTLPDHGMRRRRRTVWTRARFCHFAARFFRVDGLAVQEEMDV